VEVNTEPTAGGHESKMLIQTAAGTEPDLMWTASIGNLYDFVAYDVWLPLDAYAKRDNISMDDWYPAAVETMREDGILWALPLWSHPSITGLYYNKDKFDEAGLEYPNENWTQDKLLETAQQLTKRGESGEAADQQWGYRPLTGYYNGFLQDIWAAGGSALNKERTQSMFNEGVVRDAIQRVYDWFHRYRTVRPPEWSWGGSSAGYLPQSTLAMWANGYWGWWGSQAWDFNWGVTQLPKGRGGTNGGMLQTDAIPIARRSEFPDAAWELHKLHSSKEGGLMLNDHRLIPSSRPDVWTDAKLTATEAHRSWHQTLLSAHPLEYPANLWVSQFHSQLTAGAHSIWKGELSVDQGVQQLTRVAVNILNRPRPRL
jgi:multiple sugar transport system substrate-binding protein